TCQPTCARGFLSRSDDHHQSFTAKDPKSAKVANCLSVTRKLSVSTLRDTIATLLPDINYKIPPDDFVVDTVDRAGANACPPVIVGVGVGGTFETAALLAKRAALRP